MDQDDLNQELVIPALGGIDERNTPTEIPLGDFAILEGLYSSKNGQLTRLPQIQKLYNIQGEKIISLHATNDRNNTLLVQTTNNLYSVTFDELIGIVPFNSNLTII